MSSCWEVPNQCPRRAAVRDRSAFTYDALPVYPNPFQTERGNIDTTRAGGQIRYAALLAAADGLRVEHDDIRMRARDETASIRDAIGIGETACHHLHALLKGQVTALPNSVTEQMQSETRVAQERQMGAGITEANGRTRVDQ